LDCHRRKDAELDGASERRSASRSSPSQQLLL